MQQRVLQTLEFPKIIAKLIDKARSNSGKKTISQLELIYDLETLRQELDYTQEAVNIITVAQPPFGGFSDLSVLITKLRLGTSIELLELLDFLNVLYSMRGLKRFFKELDCPCPNFAMWSGELEILGQLEKNVENIIDEHGAIKDTASIELSRLRRERYISQRRLKNTLESTLKNPDYQKYFQDNIITIRNNRYVIPIKQEYRYQFPGVIHDQSSSGSTLFIEPMPCVDLNNNIRQLILDEEREVERILRHISEQIVKNSEALLYNCEIMTRMDVILSKAYLAQEMEASYPEINATGHIDLIEARHPLIDADVVVPIDLRLGKDFQALLITGPNTGGKTVSMKTLGLLVAMTQIGCFIPVKKGSKISIFKHIYADIGDEQSIEQSLSTFSAHMTNIIEILSKIEADDLLLLDELGSGTDPEEGAALAMAIIEYLMNTGCKLMATTHYNELKTFAYNTANIENASVEFDVESLRPTYRLIIGTAGASNAYAISQRLGLSDSIIKRAQALTTAEHLEYTAMVQDLEVQKKFYEEQNALIASQETEIAKLHAQMATMREEMAEKRKRMVEKTKNQCADLLRQTRREAEEIIKELKAQFNQQNQQKRQEILDSSRHRLSNRLAKFNRQKRKNEAHAPLDMSDVRIGDIILVNTLQQKATVLSFNTNQLEVQIGSLRMNVKPEDCSFISSAPTKAPVETRRNSKQFNAVSKVANISTQIDVRGLMVDEACQLIGKYIDDAVIAGLQRVLIIHGKGTGALRKGIHQYLKNHRNVISYTLANINEGGSGATEVQLK